MPLGGLGGGGHPRLPQQGTRAGDRPSETRTGQPEGTCQATLPQCRWTSGAAASRLLGGRAGQRPRWSLPARPGQRGGQRTRANGPPRGDAGPASVAGDRPQPAEPRGVRGGRDGVGWGVPASRPLRSSTPTALLGSTCELSSFLPWSESFPGLMALRGPRVGGRKEGDEERTHTS